MEVALHSHLLLIHIIYDIDITKEAKGEESN